MKVKSIWTMDNLNFHWTQRKIVWNIKNKNFHWPLTEVVCLYKFGSVLNFHNPMIVKHSHLAITGAWNSSNLDIVSWGVMQRIEHCSLLLKVVSFFFFSFFQFLLVNLGRVGDFWLPGSKLSAGCTNNFDWLINKTILSLMHLKGKQIIMKKKKIMKPQ